jgi:hypothetical protein
MGIDMPKVITKKGVKRFPYTKKGKEAAKKYAKNTGGTVKKKKVY